MMSGLLRDGTGVVLDVKWLLDRAAIPEGVELWRL
jgi:UDP-N-acetyl-D-galactosamine dehydrogenase